MLFSVGESGIELFLLLQKTAVPWRDWRQPPPLSDANQMLSLALKQLCLQVLQECKPYLVMSAYQLQMPGLTSWVFLVFRAEKGVLIPASLVCWWIWVFLLQERDPCLPPQPRFPQQEIKASCCRTKKIKEKHISILRTIKKWDSCPANYVLNNGHFLSSLL